jgi:hypothetical protein
LAAGDLYVVEGMFASHEVLETRAVLSHTVEVGG